jgi:hypothetical protein
MQITLSSLTYIEKQKLERGLRMDGGYVLDFSNRAYEEFFREVVGVQIYDSRYDLYAFQGTLIIYAKRIKANND